MQKNNLNIDLLNRNKVPEIENNVKGIENNSNYCKNIILIINLIEEFNHNIEKLFSKSFNEPPINLNNRDYFLVKSSWFKEFKNIFLYDNICEFLKKNKLIEDEKVHIINDLSKKIETNNINNA